MPFDGWSVFAIVIAAGCLGLAWRTKRWPTRLALVLAAALVVRLDASWQSSLHPWDERFHALVARNLVDHPLKPMLYARPALPYDYRDWAANHVWLHKPPLAMWTMAASLGAFGRNTLALRLPSVVVGVTTVLLTAAIGAHVFGRSVGLLAAGYGAVNGFLVSLVSGRRVADHVDTMLIACIAVGVWIAISGSRRSSRATTIGVGVALGAALLAKAWPAFIILIVAGVAWWGERRPSQVLRRLAAVMLIAMAVAGPWIVYATIAFPEESRWSSAFMLRHLSETVDNSGGSWWSHTVDAPRFFGELVWIPVAWFLWRAGGRASPPHRALAAWIVVTYAVFSAAATKMPNFVMIAAPAVFVAEAAFWVWLRDRWREMPQGGRRSGLAVWLFLLACLPARSLLQPSGPFERRDRFPADIEAVRTLDARLGLDDAVIFNLPQNIEAMFYSRSTVYARLPNPGEIEAVQAAGRRVIVHRAPGGHITWPDSSGVIVRDVLAR